VAADITLRVRFERLLTLRDDVELLSEEKMVGQAMKPPDC
jgi:hypothetical protein